MIPASYVHERHWGADTPRKGTAAEDAYYASVGGGAIAILHLWQVVERVVAAVLNRTGTEHSRAPQASSDVACRA